MQPSDSVGQGVFTGGGVQTAGVALSRVLCYTSSSQTFKRELNDIVPEVLIPLLDEHQSGEEIKTEVELTVLL